MFPERISISVERYMVVLHNIFQMSKTGSTQGNEQTPRPSPPLRTLANEVQQCVFGEILGDHTTSRWVIAWRQGSLSHQLSRALPLPLGPSIPSLARRRDRGRLPATRLGRPRYSRHILVELEDSVLPLLRSRRARRGAIRLTNWRIDD